MITQEALKVFLEYNPKTGLFTWIARPANRIQIGDVAGRKANNGYIGIQIFGEQILAHRLAFLYMIGRFPKEYVDHINHVKDDNRWCNLREVTPAENSANQEGLIVVNYNGIDMPMRQACKLHGTSYTMAKQRVRNGACTPIEAVMVPNVGTGNPGAFIRELVSYRRKNSND